MNSSNYRRMQLCNNDPETVNLKICKKDIYGNERI